MKEVNFKEKFPKLFSITWKLVISSSEHSDLERRFEEQNSVQVEDIELVEERKES